LELSKENGGAVITSTGTTYIIGVYNTKKKYTECNETTCSQKAQNLKIVKLAVDNLKKRVVGNSL